MTITRRLTILEQRIKPKPAAPTAEPFDHEAYAAWFREMEALPPGDLAAICAEQLAVAAWPEWPGFDWPGYTRVYFELLAGNPPNWHELVEEAER